ncbi:MAG: hypothetical protein LW822_07930 [Phycisphaeraceae bacterium]|nr:hypothetical protein [Phycisphaeraceae bacterium]
MPISTANNSSPTRTVGTDGENARRGLLVFCGRTGGWSMLALLTSDGSPN